MFHKTGVSQGTNWWYDFLSLADIGVRNKDEGTNSSTRQKSSSGLYLSIYLFVYLPTHVYLSIYLSTMFLKILF